MRFHKTLGYYYEPNRKLAHNNSGALMLQQVELFRGLTPDELETLSATSTTRSFPKNTVVIHENDPADSLFVIETGKVKV